MKTFLSLFIIIVLLMRIPVITGCANIIPPTGGPKDTTSPVLVSAQPPNNNLHFNAKKITLVFDEYIVLKDVRTSLIVSPVPVKEPLVESKLKTVTVTLKDSLKPNTTYSLNFGDAIRDDHEGNIFKDFTYVFSTGAYIDSMEYSGQVLMAISGKADSTLTVMLHDRLDDSAIIKEKPRYITRLDSSGYFKFHHLHPGIYALYALKDEGGSHVYNSGSQAFAFADSPIVIGPTYKPAQLYAYEDTTGGIPVKKPSTVTAVSKKQEKEKRLLVSVNISGAKLDLLSKLQLSFQVPLKDFDSNKVHITNDTFGLLRSYHFLEDSDRQKITVLYNWAPDTRYHLILAKDFAQDTLGNQLLKTDTISFTTRKESEYGSVKLRFRNVDLNRNPVLQFVQNDHIVLSSAIGANRIYSNKLFTPGEYELRILYDQNRNGVWDPGQFFGKHKQPELVQRIKRKLNVKVNWDNEADVNL